MFRFTSIALALVGFFATTVDSAEPQTKSAFAFRDVGEELGLFPALTGIYGHGAGWGDADGDGFVDLYVATFADKPGTIPNRFFRQRDGRFVRDDQPTLEAPMRGNTPLFVDLDNDGDLDLYVASMPNPKREILGCRLYRNDGGGKYVDVSTESGACPEAFGGRSLSAFDYDGDGLLDLLVGEEPMVRYNGSSTRSSRLFHNAGGLKFRDVSREAGLPADVPGLGTCVGDFNDDGLPDFFLSSHDGGNKMFLNQGGRTFREARELNELFHWPDAGGDNMVTGVATGDVNLDGRLDLIVGPHYDSPWRTQVGPRLFLNVGDSAADRSRGKTTGGRVARVPQFKNATDTVGLTPLALKCPHVEIQDFDNDGLPDVSVSIVKFAAGRPYPILFRNTGLVDGRPKFVLDGWNANDFPTDADRNTRGTRGFFANMIASGKIIYSAPGPTADFDNDGRLDMFLTSWWPEARSLLLKNETVGGHWLQVVVIGSGMVNRMGLGSKVKIYRAGKLGDPAALVGFRELAIGFGYASGQPAIAHFGLGKLETVDVEVTLPHGAGKLERRGVAVDRRIVVE